MSILCSMVGASFSTVTAVVTVLRSKKGITAVGNAQIDTAQSKFGGASLLGDGTGDYLQLPTDSSLELTGDFTVEMWYRIPSTVPAILPFYNSDHLFYLTNDGGTAKYALFSGGSNRLLSSGITVSANTWYHFAMVRSGTTVTAYHNGTSAGSATWAGTISGTTPTIGSYSSYYINGWFDEIRISKTARYTAAFTAPTLPFVNDDNTVLLVHANGTDGSTFFDDDNGIGRTQNGIIALGNAQISTAQSKFGSTSIALDGTGDRLDIAYSSDLALGTTNWTVEYWIRITTQTGQYTNTVGIWDDSNADGATYYFSCNMYDTTRTMGVQYYYGGNNSGPITFGSTLTTGTWQHHAFVKNGNTLTAYKDGVSQGTHDMTGRTISPYNSTPTTLKIGGLVTAGYLNGYMDEVRISNNARYTSAFTAPTAPFVSDANTLLLIHADGANASTVFLDDNSGVPTTAPTTAVTLNGSNQFYNTSGVTTTATDGKYFTFAINFYMDDPGYPSGTNLMHLLNLYLPGGNGFYIWINGGRMQVDGGVGGFYEQAEFSITPYAWNQVVMYMDTTTRANCRVYVNGVNKTLDTGGNPNNTNINWGATGAVVTIGAPNNNVQSAGAYFKGRINQVYLHNASGAPDINRYWYFGSNRPRDLGTNGTATGLAQPLIYHYGSTSTFATNNGTGFNSYTLTNNNTIVSGNGPNYA